MSLVLTEHEYAPSDARWVKGKLCREAMFGDREWGSCSHQGLQRANVFLRDALPTVQPAIAENRVGKMAGMSMNRPFQTLNLCLRRQCTTVAFDVGVEKNEKRALSD